MPNRRFVYQLTFIMVLSLLLVTAFATSGFAVENVKATVPQFEPLVKEFIQKDTELRNWKLLDLKIRPVSEKLEGTTAEVVFDVERIHLLNYERPELVPALKARIAFLEQNETRLSPAQLKAVREEVEIWKHDLAEYISTPQYCFDRLKLTGEVSNGSIIPGSVRIYREGPLGDYEPARLEDIPTPQQVEKESVEAVKEIAEAVQKSADDKQVQPLAVYDRLAARDYANNYTSNPGSKSCPHCYSTSSSCDYQNSSYYNNSSYNCWCCADCANFVSQASRRGGIPTDATWYPYSNAWKNVIPLKDHMINKGYWEIGSLGTCVAGYPFRLTSGEHIMMMVFNDGTTRKFSAHTNDRRQVTWSGSAYYYRVVY
ncbi:hypothetical protein DK28_0206095 [Peptococcaceae bacterium SCADC1_2_3]|nr:hypothetical protein DK28_0206095 [Peptococcaceae bacterium SCADC1_2_3]KFI34680.1 hypothetical protein HY00_10455 [Peptococcaceae bacterium SCADC1_2_3]